MKLSQRDLHLIAYALATTTNAILEAPHAHTTLSGADQLRIEELFEAINALRNSRPKGATLNND